MAGMYGCFKGQSSDGAAMASGPPDSTNQEPAEVQEECSGKKKSKFQTFKKFFTRKKRKEPSTPGAEAGLKASQSSDNVSKTSENNTLTRSEKDKGSGSKISLGSKALSHDSVFVSDSSETNEALGASQDSIHGKVKSLQLQLKQAIKLGSPPSLMCVKKLEDAGTMSEDDGLPCSPPECSTPHTVVNRDQMKSSNSLLDSDDDQLSCAASSRAVSPLVVPGDFSQPASPFGCLDNSAAKHKLGLRQKACNRRKPASRLEWKTEADSAVEEMLTISVPGAEAEALEEQKQQKTEDADVDQLKPKLEREEEEDEEDEERGQLQDSTVSLLRDKEKGEEGEDESEAEQDVSHGPDASCSPELSLSEEEGSDDQALPSSNPSSRASPVDSPRATPEPSAAPTEHLMGPPDTPYKADDGLIESDSASVEEDMVQENKEEESSLLEEVLSSLKTPLASSSLDTEAEDVVLEMKEDMGEKEEGLVETEECVEMKGEEPEVDKSVCRAASPCPVQTDQSSEDEEETVSPSTQQEEVNAIKEEESREEEGEDKEEDLVLERLTQDSSLLLQNEEEGQDEKPEKVKFEDENMFTSQSLSQEREEGEEEAIELDEEPEVEEEGLEKMEEEEEEDDDDDGEVEVQVNEVMEVEEAEEMTEMIPGSQDEEIHSASPLQEADEAVVLEADTFCNTNDEISAGLHDQAGVQEKQENVDQNSEDEREDEEEDSTEDDFTQKISEEDEQNEEMEENQLHIEKTEQDLEHESDEMTPHLDMAQVQMCPSEAAEQATVSPKPPPLHLSDSLLTHSQESAVSPSSKTTIMHVNLASPSSEKDASSFQLLPTAADHSKSVPESPSSDADSSFSAKQKEASADREQADAVEDVEEEPQPALEQEESSPAIEEAVTQSPDQSKVRFTIAPAWQRSQNVAPPPSPPACVSSPREHEEGATTVQDQDIKPEPASATKAELVLSPSRVMNAESTAAKPQSSTTPAPGKPASSAPASTVESSVKAEGNPDNPFGVRLRKTSALLRFSSEEENQEPPVESPTPPASCIVDTLHPVSSKPAICPPFSNKPALPKKPEVHGDAGGKPRRISDSAGSRGISGASDPPNWISVAKQKQKIYKENSRDEIHVKKDEQDGKSSLPTYVSSAASRELSNKTAESTSNVAQLEISKPSVSVGKEPRRTLSPPTPVPPQPSKSQPLPCPVAPKPQVPPATSKPPPPTSPPQRSLSPPTPVPVPPKSLPCSTPSYLSKTTTSPKTPPVTPPPLSSRPCPPEKAVSRAPGLSGQAVSPQRSLSPPALSQDEPPWMALAKKKAKAWSEMPQIVQ